MKDLTAKEIYKYRTDAKMVQEISSQFESLVKETGHGEQYLDKNDLLKMI